MSDFYNLKVNINKAESTKRLDKALTNILGKFSRSHIKILIENGNVKKNNKIINDPSYIVKEGEIFEVSLVYIRPKKYEPEELKLEIIYEDEDLLVINKKAGMVTHPAPGNENGTLVNALLYYTKNKLSKINNNARPGIVHRLDKNTSGLLISAKNESTYINLVRQLKERLISRKYLALVVGEPISGGKIDEALGRHPRYRTKQAVVKKGKNALTFYKIVEKYRGYSLLEASLSTGRTHQIRVHFSYVGYPVVGDNTYGGKRKFPAGISEMTREKISQFPRQALHASKLQFRHPQTGNKVSLHAPLPRDMSDLISFLKRNV